MAFARAVNAKGNTREVRMCEACDAPVGPGGVLAALGDLDTGAIKGSARAPAASAFRSFSTGHIYSLFVPVSPALPVSHTGSGSGSAYAHATHTPPPRVLPAETCEP